MNYFNLFNQLRTQYNIAEDDENANAIGAFLEIQSKVADKPLFTEAGLEILEYLQTNNISNAKAKDIADGMGSTSRKVSGSIRKLVTDGFVDKQGQNPVVYILTEKGKTFDINNYKESLNNEEEHD